MPSPQCPLCHHDAPRMMVQLSTTAVVWECPQCGGGVLQPAPTDDELAAAYPDDTYYAYTELETPRNGASLADHLRQRLRQYAYEGRLGNPGPRNWPKQACAWLCQGRFAGFPQVVRRGRLLDVGCGDGYFLAQCRQYGWEVSGVEWSRTAAARARARGFQVWGGDFLVALVPDTSFDVVRLWHVLEHLRDPDAAVRKASRLLVPRGELIIGVPNPKGLARRVWGSRWSGWDVPRHLYHFSVRSLRLILERHGFVVTRVDHRSVGTGLASLGGPLATSVIGRGLSLLADTFLDVIQCGDGLEIHAVKGGSG